ncbi:MAG: DMT family transporter [Candidatus Magasanikbacteria bacterium]|nr:DMT family transporter [Candidatus Magasanikbacteria bacterium]
MWLYIALLGFACGAVVNILDKFILAQKKVLPSVFVFYSAIFLLPLLFVAPLVWPLSNLLAIGPILLTTSLGFLFGLYTMYRAELYSEVSHVAPLIGALIPLFILFFSRIFLNEVLQTHEYFGVALLVVGSLIISFEISREHFGWHRGMLWAVVAAFSFAVFNVGSKVIYNEVGFTRGLVWVWGFMSVYAVLLLVFARPVRQAVFGKTKDSLPEVPKTSAAPMASAAWVVLNKFLALVSLILVQYAVALGSVSIVNALAGVQYAFLIILVAWLSRYRPRVFAEKYGRGEKAQEAAAIIFIILGLALILK